MENLSVIPTGGTTRWAVSQASPMRRVHIRGNLELMPAWWGYSSGGFIANSRIDGQVQSGSQQQWYTRDSAIGNWAGSVWNMVFSGVAGAPAQTYPDAIFSTSISGTKLPSGPVLVFTTSCVPSCTASIISRSPPSAALGNCWHL